MTPNQLALILLTIWGACVGSFLNVVIYRLPEGLSVVSPPSRCPKCEKKLAAWDNIPILGWLWLRGKCRYCKVPISIQYPIVELVTALLFGALVYIYYFTNLRPAFDMATVGDSWSVLAVHLVLVAAMIAATMIDAKLYIIPLKIPWLATGVALVVLPVSVAMGWVLSDDVVAGLHYEMLVPVTDQNGLGIALGGTVGLMIAVVLLWRKVLPMSFAQEPELPEGADPDDPNMIAYHPHPRREVSKELLFLLFPIVGALIGLAIVMSMNLQTPSPVMRTLGGVLLGYLGGGGIVWGTRLLGTYMFGKEAMGLGDVHLMAAIGAVIGWRDTTLAFFIAPFFGLAAAVIMAGVSALIKGQVRVIPYGPYLCGAAFIVMLFRTPIMQLIFP